MSFSGEDALAAGCKGEELGGATAECIGGRRNRDALSAARGNGRFSYTKTAILTFSLLYF